VSSAVATFPFANPSFLNGVAHVFDFEGRFTTYNDSLNGEEADAKAIYCDWSIVGQSLCDAMNKFSVEADG
jgi:hypothetical protein